MIPLKTNRLMENLLTNLIPPGNITVSEWADNYRVLSPEASSSPGKWRTEKTEYLRDIMDAVTDIMVMEITFMGSSQIAKTEFMLNVIAYFADVDPCPMLLLQPSRKIALEFSKERIKPLFRDVESLAKKVTGTTLKKEFPGGYLAIVSANSPDELASKPIRIVLADEVDRYTDSAKQEGNPLLLAEKRTNTFWNRKLIRVSSPTIKGHSKIEELYEQSDMAQWCVPCPSCGERQPYTWENLDFETLEMSCEHCGSMHTELEWKNGKGKWISRKENTSHRGFHLHEMASPWKTWGEMVKDFKKAKGDLQKLMVFYNTSLGRSWELREDKEYSEKWKKVMSRARQYEAEVPNGVVLLTAGIDVQPDRFEIEVVGWGEGKTSYGIEYKIIKGDPDQIEIWQKLETYLKKKFLDKQKRELSITFSCIDTGGHNTHATYAWLKRTNLSIRGIKGKGGEYLPIIHTVSKENKGGISLVTIGVDALKDSFFNLIDVQEGEKGYCYFPLGNGYSEEYFKSLISEKKILKYNPQTGTKKLQYFKIRARNEGLDIRNYARAALEMLEVDLDSLAKTERDKVFELVESKELWKKHKKQRRQVSKGVNS